jgi:hypothetical protein
MDLPKRECQNLLATSDMIKKLNTSNEHFKKAYSHMAIKLTHQYCPDDIHVFNDKLVIAPCPFHTSFEPNDQLTFDPYSMKFRCYVSSDIDLSELIDDVVKKELEEAKKEEAKRQKEEEKKKEEEEEAEGEESENEEEEEEEDEEEEESEGEINTFAIPAVLTEKDQLKDLYERNAEYMRQKGLNCTVFGNAGLVCEPCPIHKNERFDALIFDLNKSSYWRCAKELDKDHKDITIYTVFDEGVKQSLISKSKITKADTNAFNAQIVARNYLANNILISLQEQKNESYRVFKYVPENGIYDVIVLNKLESQLQILHHNYFNTLPSLSLLKEIRNMVCELSSRDGGLEIFSWDKGDVYYLPGKKRDIEINKTTGEVKFLEKDPINRPFIKRTRYSFDTDPPLVMPKELSFIFKYTTPKFVRNILAIMAKSLTYKGADYIFINMSRVHNTGKTSFIEFLRELAGRDTIAEIRTKHFYAEFTESTFIDKTLLVIDEYKGLSDFINQELKHYASEEATIPADRKYQSHVEVTGKLSVLINTNRLRLPEESLAESAFMKRIKITPFVYVWKEKRKKLNDEIMEKIVTYLVKYVVPAFIRGTLKPVTYPLFVIDEWVRNYNGVPPDRIEEFLNLEVYKEYNEKNTRGEFVPLDKAFQRYLLWCDLTDTFPATDEEFYTKLKYIANRDGGWIVERNGVEGLFMKRRGLEFFM